MSERVDLSNAIDITPHDAPVRDPSPLTGKEKAGVALTWGIIAVLVGVLVIMLGILIWGEFGFARQPAELFELIQAKCIATTEQAKQDCGTAITLQYVEALNNPRASFRDFWLTVFQIITLNVLFPTLTALLGYVFGTSRTGNS